MGKKLLKLALRRATSRIAPDSIPLSSPRVNQRDYYSVTITAKDGSWSLLLGSCNEACVEGRWLQDGAYREVCCIRLDDIIGCDFEFTYYLSRFEFVTNSAAVFVLANYLGLYRLCALLGLALRRIRQSFYNQKSLQTRDRMALLRLLVEETMNDRQARFTDFSVMTRLYGSRWIHHPLKSQRRAYYGLLLDSLFAEGLLARDQHQYALAPKALAALSEFEDEERRHIDNKKIQRRVFWLTVITAVATVVQAWPALSSIRQAISQ